MFNNSARRPRTGLASLNEAAPFTRSEVAENIRRARAILGIDVVPVPIGFRTVKRFGANQVEVYAVDES